MLLKVLVVDDTLVYRKTVADVLHQIPNVEVVGTAGNGKIALSLIKDLKPDILTLDIEMPEMNGLEVLQYLKSQASNVGVIVVSSLTKKGGDLTMRALELGAFDFITKPEGGSTDENRENIRNNLAPLLKAFNHRREISSILKGSLLPAKKLVLPGSPGTDIQSVATRMSKIAGRIRAEVVGIGISTGGPNALADLLPKLPGDISVPILLVQHMPPHFTSSLANSLDAKCALRVKEAEDGESIQNNVVYIAPGGKQMKVALGADATRKIIRITNDPPENNCKPSVDYLFRSLAHHYVGRSTGVIMTGMGNDGTMGLKLMKRSGSTVIAQDEASCVVFGMPKDAIEAGVVDIISPLERIADEIVKTTKRYTL
jgi:two-component system, chemotaxis family, protein-glutamate methylesterase/glutaminase